VILLLATVAANAQWTTPDANQNISNTNSGNVGVKTTTPEFPLQVNNSSSNILGMAYTGTLSSTSGAGIQSLTTATPSAADQRLGFYTFGVRNAGTSYNPVAIQGFSSEAWTLNSAQGGYLSFATTPNGSATRTERLRIDHNGYVGIGTTTPSSPLSVVAPSGVRQGFQLAGAGDTWTYTDLRLTPLGTITTGKPADFAWSLRKDAFYGGDNSGPSMVMEIWRQGGGVYVPFIINPSGNVILAGASNATNGNVGIGTTAPAYKLDVSGQVNSTGGLCIAGDCRASWSAVGGSQWSNGTGGVINYNGGNVGIGTASPTQKLEVSGSALINTVYGSSAASGVLTLQSTSSTTKGTINIGVDQTTTTSIGQSGTAGNKLLVATDRLVVNNGGVRVNGATDYGDLSITKLNIANSDALQFRTTNPNIISNGSLLFTANNMGGDNVRFNVQNNSISNAFVIDSSSATPARLFDVRDFGVSKFTITGSGNVGIGTTAPASKLHVAGSVTVDGNIAAKYQDVAEWVESSQPLTAGTVVILDPDKDNQVLASTQSYDTRVAGVISLQPGITLGDRGEGRVLVAASGRVKVKVDASNGPIKIGDLLVTSDKEGVAMKSVPVELSGVRMHRPGTLIGKALQPLAQGTGEILVLLSLQ